MPKATKRQLEFRKKCNAVHKKWAAQAEECNPEMLRVGNPGAEKFWDLAIIGIGRQHGGPYLYIYSENRLVDAYTEYLRIEQGMEEQAAYESALEWVSFNITDAYHGPNTPIIMITEGDG